MFERERAAFHFIRAVNALRRGDPALAIRSTKKAMTLRAPRPYHIAFLALSYAENKDRHNARFSFMEALAMTRNALRNDDRYVHHYCLVYLTLMNTEDPVDALVKDAVSIDCRPVIKRWLPLTREDSRLRVVPSRA